MTGGQPVGERPEGHCVLQIMQSLLAEGVNKLVIVTDEPEKYQGVTLAPRRDGAPPRSSWTGIQREFREISGCTAIIYDQTCATEKRRRRKRGTLRHARQDRGHQRAGVRGVRRLARCSPTACRWSRWRPSLAASAASTRAAATRISPASRASAQLCHRRRRPAEEPERDRRAICRQLPAAAQSPSYPMHPGLGHRGGRRRRHRASSPSALCWAWPRTLEGKGVITQDAAGLAQKGGATWRPYPDCQYAQRHPHHQGRHRQGRSGAGLRPDRGGQQSHLGRDAGGATLCGAQQP